MVNHNMVVGLPKVLSPYVFCKYCVLRKHHQEPFEFRSAWHVSNPLDMVLSDLCCINKPSVEGARYVLTFIDDLSHYTWVYFLKNKSHVF